MQLNLFLQAQPHKHKLFFLLVLSFCFVFASKICFFLEIGKIPKSAEGRKNKDWKYQCDNMPQVKSPVFIVRHTIQGVGHTWSANTAYFKTIISTLNRVQRRSEGKTKRNSGKFLEMKLFGENKAQNADSALFFLFLTKTLTSINKHSSFSSTQPFVLAFWLDLH